MEISKLSNLIWDLIEENSDLNYSSLLSNLISSISQNQPDQIQERISEIEKQFCSSSINDITISNFKILEEIDGLKYFGTSGFNAVKDILGKFPFNSQLTIQKLTEYNTERETFIKRITQLKGIFEKLKIDLHFYKNDIYEVGLILPEKVTDNSIKNVTKNLNRWDQIFKTLKELTGETVEDTKISLVNNGSLEFFFENAMESALCLSLIIERLATLHKRIIEIRIARKKLSELGAPKTETKNIEKHENSEIEKEIKNIVKLVIKEYAVRLETGRRNELRNALTGQVKFIAKSLDKGISIEITPPEISIPDILSEKTTVVNKLAKENAKKLYEAQLAKIEMVNKSTTLVKEIINTGKDAFKFLTNGEMLEDSEDK